MRLLLYKDLNLRRVRAAFDKVRAAIEGDDFRSADVKKLHVGGYYRARLDHANRLLLQFVRTTAADGSPQTVCLALEVIENHAYEKSRFLRGATVDESRIEREPETAQADATAAAQAPDATPLRWLHPSRAAFELLDKPLQFDDAQEAVYRLPAPVVIIGSAGSGKTAVTLAKLREASGQVLYVTLSSYLAQAARALHAAHGFQNPAQEVEFLSFRELVETLAVPAGREVTLAAFRGWFDRQRAAVRTLGEIDAHALFEEFRGVIGAPPDGPLSLADYAALGPRQSLLAPEARPAAHALFERYRAWLGEAGLFDANLVAQALRARLLAGADAPGRYDFVVIDEVQDLTPAQLALVLVLLKTPGNFLLCGDSHQIVHPNFFSWSAVRALFWRGLAGAAAERQQLQVLQANFRNTAAVTELANRLLRIKQARFGSVDRESNFLVRSTAADAGQVLLLPARDSAAAQLAQATRASARHAVIVLRDEDKAEARAVFRTPLVFSVHEAKGLEYAHVLLVNIVSGQRQVYAQVCDGVTEADLAVEDLEYRRARDKADKSLELYKFHVNALYVAMTRAVQSLTLIESDPGHPLLGLLGLRPGEATIAPVAASSRDEWALEARRLAQQGKDEQAQAIRDAFLQHRPVPWTPWSREHVTALAARALDPKQPGSKPRQALFDYALWHGQQAWVTALARAGFGAARALVVEDSALGHYFRGAGFRDPDRPGSNSVYVTPSTRLSQERVRKTVHATHQRVLQPYYGKNVKDVLRLTDAHGTDHRTPAGAAPLMLAAVAGNAALVRALLERGADPDLRDEFGHSAWDMALNHAMREPAFARSGLPAVFELLAPGALDVQTQGRLVRLERQQAEYWVLSLMLAGLKHQWSSCFARSQGPYQYDHGFIAEQLHVALEPLPDWLWPDKRRKRTYLNQVLARAEIDSGYRPSRQLWVRAKSGSYLPNPDMGLRRGEAWAPVYEALALDWIDRGCAPDMTFMARPAAVVAGLRRTDSAASAGTPG